MTEGFNAYGLVAPQKLLVPGPQPGVRVEKVNLAGQSAKLERITRDDVVSYRLVIDCENMPHCHSCECDPNHYITLSAEAIEAMKGLLP